ncbi:pleckstriny domain-containing family G member 5-like X9 [Biomphalaria pfeifferi]|uniref:Pleckstriny domain-containing family G member 5-like X9 n=1 Tax=Biomphalaria pfeifferi TaxID=112525 RepID=A0AAD8BN78_BIOPF|nr:pleckstriny domain-containing family G member 5-like X9 [Biomphalaria pfeifferi]
MTSEPRTTAPFIRRNGIPHHRRNRTLAVSDNLEVFLTSLPHPRSPDVPTSTLLVPPPLSQRDYSPLSAHYP